MVDGGGPKKETNLFTLKENGVVEFCHAAFGVWGARSARLAGGISRC